MRALLVWMMLGVVTLAGCAEETPEPEPAVDEPVGPQYVDETRNTTVDAVGLPRDPPAPGERNFSVAPTWRLGEWWKYRVSDVFTGAEREVYRIVAGTEHGNYLVGFPADDFSNDVLVLHVPGYGDIIADDLSYSAHDVPYLPVRFPIFEGDSWTTDFESTANTLQLTVAEVNEETGKATIYASGGQGAGTYVYDVNMGEISSWQSPNYANYEIIDHGYNWEGLVRVPHDHDLIFFHGRLGGAVDVGSPLLPPTPVLPIESVQIDGSYDRLSFAIILQDLAGNAAQQATGQGVAAGVYQVTATDPSGNVYTETLSPADMVATKTTFFGADEPVGSWDLQFVAAGPGFAFLEGIGYHSIDIDLPSGCVVASARSDHHQNLDGC